MPRLTLRQLERRTRKRANYEDPENKGHPLRFFYLRTFISAATLNAFAALSHKE